MSFSVIRRSITRPDLPEVVAGPTAELHGESVADTGEMADGLGSEPLTWSESFREGVWTWSELGVRCVPLGMGVSKPVLGEDVVGELKGWKPFIVGFGSSSIRRLDLRRLWPGAVEEYCKRISA